MIKLFLFNNVRREEVGQVPLQELLLEKDIYAALLQKFQELGCVVEAGRGSLRIMQEKELVPFDETLLQDDGTTVVYLDIVKLDNAKEYDRKNGIVYFFHTAEHGHLAYPHIHARHSGDDISIYLKDYHIIGKFKSGTKQKEAVEYVKSNRNQIGAEWNSIIIPQGGPKWED